jgi:hypothetical protein
VLEGEAWCYTMTARNGDGEVAAER